MRGLGHPSRWSMGGSVRTGSILTAVFRTARTPEPRRPGVGDYSRRPTSGWENSLFSAYRNPHIHQRLVDNIPTPQHFRRNTRVGRSRETDRTV